jgi:hypothetical protein
VHLKVKNPTYIRVQLRLSVRFRQGYNPEYYRETLNQDLQRFLAPWAYDQSADIFFGGDINTSLVINFVEERPYVDYVAGIKVFTSQGGEIPKEYIGPGVPFPPDAILVSDRSHVIDLIKQEAFDMQYFTGINYMKIELDFQVASVKSSVQPNQEG